MLLCNNVSGEKLHFKQLKSKICGLVFAISLYNHGKQALRLYIFNIWTIMMWKFCVLMELFTLFNQKFSETCIKGLPGSSGFNS